VTTRRSGTRDTNDIITLKDSRPIFLYLFNIKFIHVYLNVSNAVNFLATATFQVCYQAGMDVPSKLSCVNVHDNIVCKKSVEILRPIQLNEKKKPTVDFNV